MPDEFIVEVTPQAEEQMREIVGYIARELGAPSSAMRLLDAFEREIGTLSSMPKRFPTVRREPWNTEGLRWVTVKNFILYYWVEDEAQTVHVTAVVYGRRDQVQALANIELDKE
jgi:toxin ParE1/3/4